MNKLTNLDISDLEVIKSNPTLGTGFEPSLGRFMLKYQIIQQFKIIFCKLLPPLAPTIQQGSKLYYPPGIFFSIHNIHDKINNFTYPHCAYKYKIKHQFKNKYIQKL